MAAENFFARWAKNKPDAADTSPAGDGAPAEHSAPVDSTAQPARPLPTQDDIAGLTHDSDFSVFMAQGVDENVKRSAMKKLFSDPQFNVMDGLDTYIEDYTKFKAMTPAVLASLNHAKALLDPLSQLQAPLMKLLEIPEQEIAAAAQEPGQSLPPSGESVEAAKEIAGDGSEKKHYADEHEVDASADTSIGTSKESESRSDHSDA
jgi:hypothetical protein